MQGISDLPVCTVHHAVRLSVEGSREQVLNPQLLADFSPRCRSKLRALVSGHRGRNTRTCHPPGDEVLRAHGGSHVFQRNGLNRPGGPVYDGQQIHGALL